ncbi:hypothetical protein ACFQE5_20215 [Pseudonocardia hispaniensis]|uniref:Uncharacterized protein n=1 Tax=Pseudonocardia hispaniensis TaxID=904933 RepID=A0ABW1J7Q7_9PSEU
MTDDHRQASDPAHARPDGAGDELVATVGRLSEALETVERARGALYEFHQLIGGAHGMLQDVVEGLRSTGHDEWAERIRNELLGCNVLPGRWTFQIVEEFDDGYYRLFRQIERGVRDDTMAGRRHVYEAELKASLWRPRVPGHDAAR